MPQMTEEEFLGLPLARGVAPSIQGVPSYPKQMTEEEFLGVGPGEVIPLSQSASTGAPSPNPWGWMSEALSGTAFGFGPELQGTENYLTGKAGKLTLDQSIYNARSAKESFEREHPGWAKGVEVAGSIPSVALTNMLTPGLSAAARSTSLPLRMLGGAVAGGEAGALQSKITGGDVGMNALTGAGVGAALPGAGAAFGRMMTPRVEPGIIDTVRGMEDLGIRLRPSQVAMSKAWRQADEFLASGGNERQIEDFTRAAARTIGENTERLTPAVAGRAWDRITGDMDNIAAQTTVALDPTLNNGLGLIGANLRGLPREAQNQVREAIRDVRNAFTNGSMHGTTYQRLTARGGVLMNLASGGSHPTVREAGGRLRELLDDAVERSSPPGTREAWAESRAQFKNLLAIQPLVEGNPSGLINPQAFHGAVKKAFGEYGWGAPQGAMEMLGEGGRFLAKPKLTGDASAKEPLSLMWRYGPGVALGAGGAWVVGSGDPKTWALMGLGLTGSAVSKKLAGGALRSNFSRNALTGRVSEPGIISSTTVPVLTGAVNMLNGMDADEIGKMGAEALRRTGVYTGVSGR